MATYVELLAPLLSKPSSDPSSNYQTPIDKVALAKLTGHDKPNSAAKIW